MIVNEGFVQKRKFDTRLPPGQYETKDFPVLSLGPTPEVGTKDWKLEVCGLVKNPCIWNWDEFRKLPHEAIVKDVHCVTKWSKFDTNWGGVSLDLIMKEVGVLGNATYVVALSFDGYTTNLPIKDIRDGKAWVATAYRGEAIPPEHGGPARLFVPHLYFWKSAKWLKKLEFIDHDQPGFWEVRGYHNYGDPWREERYTFD